MQRAKKRAERAAVRSWFNGLRRWYRKFLLGLLRFRYLLFVVFIAGLIGALWYAGKNMDFILFPTEGADTIYIGVETKTGTSLRSNSERVRAVEKVLQELPPEELDTFVTRVGTFGWVWTGEGENYAYLMVNLTPYSRRTRTADEIVEEIRTKTENIEGIERVLFYIDAGGPPVGRAVTLRVIGYDDEKRRELTDEITAMLGSIQGVKDIERDDKLGKEQIEVKIDYEKLARRGLTVADVAQNVRIAFDGEVVTTLREGDEDVDFRVILQERARKDIRYLKNLTIPNVQGRLIKLGTVARFMPASGPNALYHFGGERTTTIEADVDTDVVTSLEITGQVLSSIDVENDWPELRLEVGGEAEESMKSIANLLLTFIIAFIGIYFLLILLFNSFTQPFLVMLAIPFGIIGVVIALSVHGEPLSFLAMIGAIGLAGVVVNDSLVLVNHINDLRKSSPDEPIIKVVAQGTADRLRAIILTTLTTVAGLLPLAYGVGGSALYMAPTALVLGYGLVFATSLTLVLIPSLYMIGHDIGRVFQKKRG